MKFIVQDREAGNTIAKFDTLEEAQKAVIKFESEDKEDGSYSDDFYEIVENSEVTNIIQTVRQVEVPSKYRSNGKVEVDSEYYEKVVAALAEGISKIYAYNPEEDEAIEVKEIMIYHRNHTLVLCF